jgi:hypothetical protein
MYMYIDLYVYRFIYHIIKVQPFSNAYVLEGTSVWNHVGVSVKLEAFKVLRGGTGLQEG